MTRLFYAKVSSIDYEAGTADVTLPDRENQVIRGVPFLSMVYEMPEPGDKVAAIFETEDMQIGKGIVLGKMYIDGNRPKNTGKEIFSKLFTDGKRILYTPKTGIMDIDTKEIDAKEFHANKIVVDEVIYGTMTRR